MSQFWLIAFKTSLTCVRLLVKVNCSDVTWKCVVCSLCFLFYVGFTARLLAKRGLVMRIMVVPLSDACIMSYDKTEKLMF